MSETTSSTGQVFLIGAGPGDPGLITRRGYKLMRDCDAVVYDDLIPLELVVTLPPRIQRFYVGKRAGRHSQLQEATSQLLVRLAREGLTVARLKGGDPSIFGRLCEEITCLTENGVEWTVIPGITAASAAGADGGFSLTDRSCASWLLLGVGHEAESASPPVPWQALGGLTGGTMVSYMGIGSLERIVTELIAGGMLESTPVSIQRHASRGDSRIIRGCLKDIVLKTRESSLTPPALIIVGEVVARSVPRPVKPLSGKTVLVTRPAEQLTGLCRLIRQAGGEPIPHPTIRMSPHFDDEGWIRFGASIDKGGWITFTSEMGALFFFSQLFERGFDLRALGRFKIAVVGEGTRGALREQGISADLIPAGALVSELAKELVKQPDLAGQTVVRIRGNLGDKTLEEAAVQAGANLVELRVYTNSTADWEPHWIRNLLAEPPSYIVFTSGSTFSGFLEILGEDQAKQTARASRVVAIGPMTRRTIEKAGFSVQVEAEEYNMEGIVAAMCRDV